MTFDSIYRDVWSQLNLLVKDASEPSVFYLDIVKAYNDAASKLRLEYIDKGMGQAFAVTETVVDTSPDTLYPFLNTVTLSKKVYKTSPPHKSILGISVLHSEAYVQYLWDDGNGYLITDEDGNYLIVGDNKTQTVSSVINSYPEGTNGIIGRNLFVAVEDIPSVNSYNLWFDPSNVRKCTQGNGMKFMAGDVVYDGSSYYRVNTTFTNTDSTTFLANVTKLYWKLIGDAYYHARVFPFERINALSVFKSMNKESAVTYHEDKLYCTPNMEQFTISYIPEWTEVAALTDTVNLPDYMVRPVKDEMLRVLYQKFGIAQKQEGESK